MRLPLLTTAGLSLWSGLAHACPACGGSAAADQRFGLVATLLLAGSLVLIARAVFRRFRRP